MGGESAAGLRADMTEGARASRVGLDCRHVGLTGGTGLATFTRNLAGAVRRAGFDAHALYGPRHKLTADGLLDRMALLDASQAFPKEPLKAWVRARTCLFGRTATPLQAETSLWTAPVAHQFPQSSCDWASYDLFRIANRGFRVHGGFTPLSFSAAEHAPDLMHWTSPTPIAARQIPNIYTIHDIVPLKLPYTTLDNKRFIHGVLSEIVRKADHLVAISETTKRDVLNLFALDEKRISVVYQSVSFPAALRNRQDAAIETEIANIFDLEPEGYFLFLGAVEPKKNIARLIEAYLASGVKPPLVIIGGKGWMEEQELALLHEEAHSIYDVEPGRIVKRSRVRRFPHVPFHLVMSLIRRARGVVFPSLYEGFGLPAIEAMALGAPVIASTTPALAEVAGDAALLVDPLDTFAIADAIRAIDSDADLRAELRARGVARASHFSEEAFARRLRDAYRPFL